MLFHILISSRIRKLKRLNSSGNSRRCRSRHLHKLLSGMLMWSSASHAIACLHNRKQFNRALFDYGRGLFSLMTIMSNLERITIFFWWYFSFSLFFMKERKNLRSFSKIYLLARENDLAHILVLLENRLKTDSCIFLGQ